MKHWQNGLVLCALVGGLSGCGSWMHSDKQSVTIFTNPPEASVISTTPAPHSAWHSHAQSEREPPRASEEGGLSAYFLKIDRTWSWWVLGDIFGCLCDLFTNLHHE